MVVYTDTAARIFARTKPGLRAQNQAIEKTGYLHAPPRPSTVITAIIVAFCGAKSNGEIPAFLNFGNPHNPQGRPPVGFVSKDNKMYVKIDCIAKATREFGKMTDEARGFYATIIKNSRRLRLSCAWRRRRRCFGARTAVFMRQIRAVPRARRRERSFGGLP